MEPAGFGRRYLAFLLDLLFLEILGAVVNAPLLTGPEVETGRVLMEWSDSPQFGVVASQIAGALVLTAVLWSWYFTCFHWLAGRTPGKWLLGLWVRHRDGRPLGPWTALARLWSAVLLSLISLGLAYTWAAWDRNRQTWHDKLLDTAVIRKLNS